MPYFLAESEAKQTLEMSDQGICERQLGCVLPCFGQAFWALGGAVKLLRLLGIHSLTPELPSGISMTSTWVPWYDILLFFLRVGLTKIWELGTDPIAIRGSAVLEGPV